MIDYVVDRPDADVPIMQRPTNGIAFDGCWWLVRDEEQAAETYRQHFQATQAIFMAVSGTDIWEVTMSEIDAAVSNDDDLIRAQVSRLWAEDWDSDEDAVYDSW
jgi:hypothetical protein